MNYKNVEALIRAAIKENGERGITGDGLQNVLLTMLDYTTSLYIEEDVMYGVEWDVTVADTAMTRIGNMALHRQLPIHNRMKGCLLDDNGKVVEYLPPTSWLGATRDGSRGQVMVEVPYHYRKFETDGNIRRVKLSEYPLPGYHFVPKMYVSAYEATVQRSTGMLCSVVNSDPDYRGGNNNADWDGTYRTLLGRPASSINRRTFRNNARNRNGNATSEWNCLDYNAYKTVFWLYYIEYANRNCQLAFNAEKDANGFAQGGLGAGVTNLVQAELNSYNSRFPFVPCGHTDSLGNGSGEVPYELLQGDGTVLATTYANRYRGIEQPFGHLWKNVDGVIIGISPTEANGGDNTTRMYVSDEPSNYNDSDYDSYSMRGALSRKEGYVKELVFGEFGDIAPSETGGGSSSNFSDYHFTSSSGSEEVKCIFTIGGHATHGSVAGFACSESDYTTGSMGSYIGTRLCFIPQNNK